MWAAPGHGVMEQVGRAMERAAEGLSTRGVAVGGPRYDRHVVVVMPCGHARDGLAHALWNAGFIVTAFSSAHEAEGVLVSEPVHALILDTRGDAGLAERMHWWLRALGRVEARVVAVGPAPRGDAGAPGIRHVDAVEPVRMARDLAVLLDVNPAPWR